MSLIHLIAAVGGVSVNGVVNVTTQFIASEDNGPGAQECEAGVRFNADGTVDEYIRDDGAAGVYSQINSGTDWLVPNAAAFRTHYIRATESSYIVTETNPDCFGTRFGTMGTWLPIGGSDTEEWSLQTNTNSAGSGDVVWGVLIEIASDSGGTDILDSATYTMTGLTP